MWWQSGWQITTFLSQNLYIQLSLARSHSQSKIYRNLPEWPLASERQIYRIFDKKVVICRPLCHNINMWKLLVILVVNNFICGTGGLPSYMCSTCNALLPALVIDTKGLCFEIRMRQILVVEHHKINFEQTCLVMFHRVARKYLTPFTRCISESCIRIKN